MINVVLTFLVQGRIFLKPRHELWKKKNAGDNLRDHERVLEDGSLAAGFTA